MSDEDTAPSSGIQPYDSDHTALVHVLWAARREGITIEDADRLASFIMRSRWTKAVRYHAVDACRTGTVWLPE